MARYIDAEKLKDAFHTDTEHLQSRDEHLFDLIMFEIDETPTADVAEVKHGKWIKVGTTESRANILQCSVCGKVRRGIAKTAYCKDCGAKMDG